MKESRAEQVFESFVAGNTEHTQSPLLAISGNYLMQRERGAMKRKMRQQKIVAINMEGQIIHPIMERGASQVLGMLQRVKAHEVDDLTFGLIMNALREHLGSFGQIRDFVGKSNPMSFISGFLKTLRDHNIPNPYGDTLDELLRFINRRYCRGEYRAALSFTPQHLRKHQCWNEDFAYQEDVLALNRWTFFKDETEALLLRLGDTKTKGRMEFIKLLPAEAA